MARTPLAIARVCTLANFFADVGEMLTDVAAAGRLGRREVLAQVTVNINSAPADDQVGFVLSAMLPERRIGTQDQPSKR
jgi:hypothetical protein